MSKVLREILEEKVWKTSSIIAGVDKGAIQGRNKSIDDIMEKASEELIIVGKGEVDIMLQLLTEYIMQKLENDTKTIKSEPIDFTTPVYPGTTGTEKKWVNTTRTGD